MARWHAKDVEATTPEGLPSAQGLYHPSYDHDACGIGLYANINNLASHAIIESGLTILKNLEHRGAVGADPKAGDGSGIMAQLPHEFFAGEAERLKFQAAGTRQLCPGLSVHAARGPPPPGDRAHLA